jgi:tetratricopeptide (TPR) repeat protein
MADFAQVTELVRRGIAAAKAGRKEEARQALLQVTELDEQNEQAWLWLSSIVDSPEEKRICLGNVLAVNPNNAHAQAGLQWLDQSAPPPAAPSSPQEHCPHCGVEVPPSGMTCPNCRQPLLVACPGCWEYVDVDKASCPHCGQALGDFHQGARYYLALANVYLERRRLDLVEEAAAWAEASAPGDPAVFQSAATLYEKAGRTDQAIAVYERGIEIAPGNAALYAGLGAIYRRRSEPGKARAMYEKAEQLANNDPAVLFESARLQLEQDGPTPAVVKSLQQVTRKQPMHVEAFLLLGDAYMDQDRRKQARQQYERAYQLTSPESQMGQEARRKLARLDIPDLYPPELEGAAGDRSASEAVGRRPGCVSLYAVLIGVVGVFGILGALVPGAFLIGRGEAVERVLQNVNALGLLDTGQLTAMAGAYFALLLITSAIILVIAGGLWNMRNWARVTIIALQVLGVLASLVEAGLIALSYQQSGAPYEIGSFPGLLGCGLLVGLVIQLYIIFWFAKSRKLFG